MKYLITVEEIYSKAIEIEADSEKQAIEIAQNMSGANSYVMTPNDYVQDSFSVVLVNGKEPS